MTIASGGKIIRCSRERRLHTQGTLPALKSHAANFVRDWLLATQMAQNRPSGWPEASRARNLPHGFSMQEGSPGYVIVAHDYTPGGRIIARRSITTRSGPVVLHTRMSEQSAPRSAFGTLGVRQTGAWHLTCASDAFLPSFGSLRMDWHWRLKNHLLKARYRRSAVFEVFRVPVQ